MSPLIAVLCQKLQNIMKTWSSLQPKKYPVITHAHIQMDPHTQTSLVHRLSAQHLSLAVQKKAIFLHGVKKLRSGAWERGYTQTDTEIIFGNAWIHGRACQAFSALAPTLNFCLNKNSILAVIHWISLLHSLDNRDQV